jgi:peptidase M1-like protein
MRATACLLLLLASTAYAQDASEYRDLRASRPDGRQIPVKDLTLERDAYRITLQSGAVHLLKPLGGDTFGAVFIGQGSYVLNPASAAERRQLQLVTGSTEVLRDRFTKLILLFTDKTAAEVMAHAPVTNGAPDQAATRAFEEYLERQRNENLPNLHLRVLADLLNRPARQDGVFLAFVEGQTYSPVLLAVDPLGISNLTTRFNFFGGEEVMLFSFNNQNGGLWYSSALTPQAVSGRGKPIRPLADASHYEIDTTLDGGSLRGTTTITFTPTTDGVRVLPIHLFQRLRLRTATIDSAGTPAPVSVLQDELPQGLFARLFGDESGSGDVAVQFREPLKQGAAVKLTLTYEGRDVLQCSDGRCAVGARESWYPNVGTFDDLATYSTMFHFPARNDLIGVGQQVSERTEGGQKIAVWRSEQPLRVAGFNYGDFQKTSKTDEQSGVTVDVYTIRGPEFANMSGIPMADAVNTSRVASTFFGPPTYRRISITQQLALASGQSWPTLVYLPTIVFLSPLEQERRIAGDPRALQGLKEFGNTVTWHEVAHQWWGHQIGWSSYRDQWLSEGFAEFTAALMLEVASGRKKADSFWELRRDEIFGKTGTVAVAPADAGGISQGFRLATSRSPSGARYMIYSKGAFVLHMLRMMMREDRVPDPDRLFKAMMADFVKTWSGKNPSTDDFKAIAERHMIKDMDLAANGKLDYFFNQWVHGTDIPTLTSALEVTDIGGGKYKIAGTITQAGVPADFRTRVPIYLDLGNDRLERLGTVPVTGSSTFKLNVDVNIPIKPRRAVINSFHDVLTR